MYTCINDIARNWALFMLLFNHSDACCGVCSFFPNVFRKFGWNPGKEVLDWFGEKLGEKTGNPDITFKQVNRYEVALHKNHNNVRGTYCK